MKNINTINDLLFKLANLYMEESLFFDAIFCYKKIIKSLNKNSSQILFLNNLIATCYLLSKDYKTANDYIDQILSIDSLHKQSISTKADILFSQKNYKQANKYLYKLINIEENPDTLKKIGEIHYYLKQYDKSIYYYNKAEPNSYFSSFPILATKDFLTGFKLYQERLKSNSICRQTGLPLRQNIDLPNWDGLSNCNKLLVVYEQGIGDNIMYFRFLIELAQKFPNMEIVYFCKKIVSHFLISDCKNLLITHNTSDFVISSFDYKCFIMSIPFFLKIDKITPNLLEYVYQDAIKFDYWGNLLQKIKINKKPLIGFFYKGLLISEIEKNIPVTKLLSLFDLDANFICLHKKEEIIQDLTYFQEKKNMHTYSIDINEEKPFIDSIAILKNVDLLITIDSAIVHLAGVLNVPSILLLGKVSDWRWFDNNDKIWYNSVDILHNKNENIYDNIPLLIKKIKNKFTI